MSNLRKLMDFADNRTFEILVLENTLWCEKIILK